MSGRHSGRAGQRPGISALPNTLKLAARLAPRQINDEISMARLELKGKGKHLGVAGAFAGVVLVFFSLLVIALVVAAIMGLATVMPAWLAALIVSAAFLVIILIGALIAFRAFKSAMPFVPEKTMRGIKYDLGIIKAGTAFDASVLDPSSEAYKVAEAAKAAAAEKAKAEKAAKAEAHKAEHPPAPGEAELLRRLEQRREHLADVRDQLGVELDAKTQGKALLNAAGHKLDDGRQFAADKLADLSEKVPAGLPERLATRWKELLLFAASATVAAVGLRKLFKK
ncbi:phage holin family protein [Arthrobacter sp. NA-172]|uniref:phage holin family protein n=1 Tax=Arthrobacter sp. NA-172 TaxID=3367524 RepID=UPI0037543F07